MRGAFGPLTAIRARFVLSGEPAPDVRRSLLLPLLGAVLLVVAAVTIALGAALSRDQASMSSLCRA